MLISLRRWSRWSLLCVCLALWGFSFSRSARAAEPPALHTSRVQPSGVVDIELYSRAGCPHCAAAYRYLLDLQRARTELRIRIYDVVEDSAARQRLEDLARSAGVSAVSVPALFIHGGLIIGFDEKNTPRRIEQLLASPMTAEDGAVTEQGGTCMPEEETACGPPVEQSEVEVPLLGRIGPAQLGLPVFTIVLGLLDGFNPCAMWVLVFLLTTLATLRNRARMLLVAGIFVLASGVVYFAFMAAWLNVFLLVGVSRGLQVALGGIALFVATIHIKDFFAFHKGISLSIPEGAKPGLYARVRRVVNARSLPAALAGVTVLAVLVNLVELLCTAGIPAVYTQVLSTWGLPSWQYYAYLGLYNLAYMFDDALMLAIGVATLSRRKLQEKEGRWLKLVGGIVMLALGALLLLKPEWLTP